MSAGVPESADAHLEAAEFDGLPAALERHPGPGALADPGHPHGEVGEADVRHRRGLAEGAQTLSDRRSEEQVVADNFLGGSGRTVNAYQLVLVAGVRLADVAHLDTEVGQLDPGRSETTTLSPVYYEDNDADTLNTAPDGCAAATPTAAS
jgi:hypothetical protein